MESVHMKRHFQKLKQQRALFYTNDGIKTENAWRRPQPDKWSVAETLYHLVLMVRLLRRFSIIYIPTMTPLANLRKKRPYKTEIFDIYQEYQQNKRKPMKAPFLLNPPNGLEKNMSLEGIKDLLEKETNQLRIIFESKEEDIAGQIRYPDPIAGYPNLIQSVHLLAIHEEHHFNIVKKYDYLNNPKCVE